MENKLKIRLIGCGVPKRSIPERIYLRVRHPDGKPITAVYLGDVLYDNFNAEKEIIVLTDLKAVENPNVLFGQ